jgi:hypothetical protein
MKFKTTPSAETVMSPPFRDAKGMILVDMPCGQTINSNLYQTLKTLYNHFRRVWHHKNVVGILLEHDDA